VLGRVFTREEEDGNRQVAVISYAMWLNRFHRDPAILGKTIDLDNRSYTVIGVMPQNFEFPVQVGRLNHTELWVPMSLTPDELAEAHEGVWAYQMVARLRDGVTVQQAASDVDRVAQLISRNFPPSMAAIKIRGDATSLRERVVGNVRPMLNALLGAVGIVQLIVCVNVTGLLLVRAIRRRREYALRLALGAGSGRILCESVVEGTVLSIAGGLLGLAVAAGIVRVALHLLPESMPRIDEIAINGTVVGFALLLALVTGVLCGLAPAFAATRTGVMESLKQSSLSTTGTGSHGRLRSALVVVEIAITLVLLTSSGAFLRSFEKMRSVDPGFQPEHVLVAGYRLPMTRYSTFASAELFHKAVVERLEGKPQIAAAGLTNSLPASGFSGQAAYMIEGVPVANWKLSFATFGTVSGDYFRAMGIPLLEGRYFTREDRANAPLVVIVNASMAKRCWPGQGAIGKRMHVGNPKKGLAGKTQRSRRPSKRFW
jgi:predicted permease